MKFLRFLTALVVVALMLLMFTGTASAQQCAASCAPRVLLAPQQYAPQLAPAYQAPQQFLGTYLVPSAPTVQLNFAPQQYQYAAPQLQAAPQYIPPATVIRQAAPPVILKQAPPVVIQKAPVVLQQAPRTKSVTFQRTVTR